MRTISQKKRKDSLFSTPPGESDLVLEALVLLERLGQDKESSGSATIVVDTSTGLDTVEMGTEEDDVVGVTLLGLGDDVPALPLLGNRVNKQVDIEGLASTETLLPVAAILEGNDTNGDQLANVIGAEGG